MDRNASLSAWMHEREHVLDDEKINWRGRAVLTLDKDEHYEWEKRAYSKEIEMAKSLGGSDIVKRLEELLENERKQIYEE